MSSYTSALLNSELREAIGVLIELGLSIDQNFPYVRDISKDVRDVTFHGARHVTLAMKDQPYEEIYQNLSTSRCFTLKFPDGALVQMWYRFSGNDLVRHRLALFPSPTLSQFQNNPDIYVDDVVYAEVMAKAVVPFPLRFDYSFGNDEPERVHHPSVHLTLGQYANCRIPVNAPLSPIQFLDFVVRNFYHTAFAEYADKFPSTKRSFQACNVPSDREVVFVHVPVQT